MLNAFLPTVAGVYAPERIAANFLDTLASRVQSGLFPAVKKWSRSHYVVRAKTKNGLRFGSAGLGTGIYVGLNDVEVQLDKSLATPRVLFQVKYWVWTLYCVILGLAIGLFLLAARYLIFPGHYSYVEIIFWPSVIFWCILWPWILVALHKRHVAKLLKRILDEVNQSSVA